MKVFFFAFVSFIQNMASYCRYAHREAAKEQNNKMVKERSAMTCILGPEQPYLVIDEIVEYMGMSPENFNKEPCTSRDHCTG